MSYARLVRFSCKPGDVAPAKAIAEDLAPVIRQQPGADKVVVFGDSDGEGGLFVLWCCEDHANAAATVIGPQLEQHLAGHLTAPRQARLFPVLSS